MWFSVVEYNAYQHQFRKEMKPNNHLYSNFIKSKSTIILLYSSTELLVPKLFCISF